MKTMKETIRFTPKAEALRILNALPDADADHQYVCVGAWCWGRAPKAKDAARLARENGSPNGVFVIHLCNKGAYVDEIDGTVWHNAAQSQLNLLHFRQ